MTDSLLTSKEARAVLNVSERTFRRLKLAYVLVGGSKRYERLTLDRYIATNRRHPMRRAG